MQAARAPCLPLFASTEVTRGGRLPGQRGDGASAPLPRPWGEASAEPLLQGSQMVAETQARIQLPATKSPHLFQRYLKTLWEGFLSCSSVVVPPPKASKFSPTSPQSSGAAAAKAADSCGFAVVSSHLLDALHPVTAVTKPDPTTTHVGEMLTQADLSFQHPWRCPTFPPVHSPLSLSVPLSISAEAVPKRGASMNTQGR